MDNYEIKLYDKLVASEPLTIEELKYCIEDLYVSEEVGDSMRWETPVETIFSLADKYWRIEWMRGNTEYQDNTYIENVPTQVKKTTKTITVEVWEAI